MSARAYCTSFHCAPTMAFRSFEAFASLPCHCSKGGGASFPFKRCALLAGRLTGLTDNKFSRQFDTFDLRIRLSNIFQKQKGSCTPHLLQRLTHRGQERMNVTSL